MSLSKLFLKASLAIGAGVFGVVAKAAGVAPVLDTTAFPFTLSSAEELAITQRLKSQIPVPESLWEFKKDPQIASLSKSFDDLGVRRLAFEMTASYIERCGDPLKRKDICHVNNGEAYTVLNYAWHTVFRTAELNRLGKEITLRYANERLLYAYRINCYSYAVGDYFLNPIGGANPGQVKWGGKAPFSSAESVFKGAIADGLIYAGKDPAKLEIPKGKRLVVLYINEANGVYHDFHWTRLDRKEDGTLGVHHKMGVVEYSSRYDVENIYDELRQNFASEGEGYKFSGFFYVPVEGIDVGVDAFARKKGFMTQPKKKLDVMPTIREMDVADFDTFKAHHDPQPKRSPQ